MTNQYSVATKVFSDDSVFNAEYDRLLNLALNGSTRLEMIKLTDKRHRYMIASVLRDATDTKNNEVLANDLKAAQNKFNI